MSLSAPKQVTFIVAVALAVLGLLGLIVQLGFVTDMATWLILLGFVVLAMGCLLPNL
jgi:hypothetical protein